MGQFDSLILSAKKAIDNADKALEHEEPQFRVIYRHYKNLQSFWLRMVEEASETQSRRLEDLCVDLEMAVQKCEDWIKENSPKEDEAQKDEEQDCVEE